MPMIRMEDYPSRSWRTGDCSGARCLRRVASPLRSGSVLLVGEGVAGVAAMIAAVEGCAVIPVERKALRQACRQVWVRDEIAAEGHVVGDPSLDDRLCAFALEAAGSDDRPFEYPA